MTYDQSEFQIRCEWGKHGARQLAPISDVVIIVDVLSFTTSVDIAVGRGALVYPFPRMDQSASDYAASIDAELADARRGSDRYSLSPKSLLNIAPRTRLVLPSPNGSALTFATGSTPTLAGCLRNAQAIAKAAQKYGPHIGVIAAGERWKDDSSLRPSFEDWVGAGAIISYLSGTRSPEAHSALAAFNLARADLQNMLMLCGSGKELIERGFAQDVVLAAELNESMCVPTFFKEAYQSVEPSSS